MNTDQLVSELGKKIANYRIARNLTQSELADEAGLDRTTVSRLEQGKGTLDSLARVMAALNIEARLLEIVPDTSINPLDKLEQSGQKRQRVRKAKGHAEENWSWGEDTP